MGVATPHSEGGNADERTGGERFGLGHDTQPAFFEPQRLGGLPNVMVGGNDTVLQGQDSLDEAGNSGGTFEMADIAFDGSDRQRSWPILIHHSERLRFQRIADLGVGLVQLDVAHVRCQDGGVGKRAVQHDALAIDAGNREGRHSGIVIEGGAAEDG